jgi:hypothetical protein
VEHSALDPGAAQRCGLLSERGRRLLVACQPEALGCLLKLSRTLGKLLHSGPLSVQHRSSVSSPESIQSACEAKVRRIPPTISGVVKIAAIGAMPDASVRACAVCRRLGLARRGVRVDGAAEHVTTGPFRSPSHDVRSVWGGLRIQWNRQTPTKRRDVRFIRRDSSRRAGRHERSVTLPHIAQGGPLLDEEI